MNDQAASTALNNSKKKTSRPPGPPVSVRYPDFLVIGAQKAATTWLHRHLRRHPDVWIPVIKEVHYFDEVAAQKKRLALRQRPPWISETVHRLRLIRKSVRTWYSRGFTDTRFWAQYAFGSWDDRWYGRLFAAAMPSQIAGELTPAYATLGREEVAHIRQLMPKARIIFLLRNPVHRTWSAMKMMNISPVEGIDPATRHAWAPFVESEGTRLRSDYLRTLEIWENVFSPEQVLVGFYEEVKSNPEELLSRVCRFIGVSETLPFPKGGLRSQVNVSQKTTMPQGLQRYLSELYYPDLVRLHERFGGPTKAWLREAEELLQK